MLTRSPKRILAFMADVVQIAKWLDWKSDVGNKKAQALVNEIHSGKYGAGYGIWPQIDEALETLKKALKVDKKRQSIK